MVIHLLGTVHYEFNGPRRLKNALDKLKPDVITVEASQKWIKYLEDNWDPQKHKIIKELRERGCSENFLDFFSDYIDSASYYEVDISKEYADRNNIPIYLIDNPNMIDILSEELNSLYNLALDKINPKDLDEVNKESIIEKHDSAYRMVQYVYEGKLPRFFLEKRLINPLRGTFVGLRDETEAKFLGEINGDYNMIVHVGGCYHNLDDSKGETLYSRLKKYNPKRSTLILYD
ncbi:hypothetical protein ACFL1H_06250 [Nanoarchaeota archaeon]